MEMEMYETRRRRRIEESMGREKGRPLPNQTNQRSVWSFLCCVSVSLYVSIHPSAPLKIRVRTRIQKRNGGVEGKRRRRRLNVC